MSKCFRSNLYNSIVICEMNAESASFLNGLELGNGTFHMNYTESLQLQVKKDEKSKQIIYKK